eukprot:gene23453-17311_t
MPFALKHLLPLLVAASLLLSLPSTLLAQEQPPPPPTDQLPPPQEQPPVPRSPEAPLFTAEPPSIQCMLTEFSNVIDGNVGASRVQTTGVFGTYKSCLTVSTNALMLVNQSSEE